MLVVVLLSGGAAMMIVLIQTSPDPPLIASSRPPLTVRAVKLQPRPTREVITGYGTARADRLAWVATQVAGEIVEVSETLKPGAWVSSAPSRFGAASASPPPSAPQAPSPEARAPLHPLVRIDEREYRAALDRARSQLAADQAILEQLLLEEENVTRLIEIAGEESAAAEREYGRIRDLLEQGNSNPREADQARMVFERARRALQVLINQKALLPQRRVQQEATCRLRRADVTLALLNVERCTIYAPFAGQLDQVNAELGQRVRPGELLFSILDPVRIEVPIELPISLRGHVQPDAACRLSLESRADAVWTGRVARIAPSADEMTRTFALFVEVDNSTQAQPLIPGMFVRGEIDGLLWNDALVVPRGCIQDQRVFVYRDGRAFRKAVHVLGHLLDRAVISGLNEGEIVITSNLDTLYDGAPVQVLLPQASGPESRAPTGDPQSTVRSPP